MTLQKDEKLHFHCVCINILVETEIKWTLVFNLTTEALEKIKGNKISAFFKCQLYNIQIKNLRMELRIRDPPAVAITK